MVNRVECDAQQMCSNNCYTTGMKRLYLVIVAAVLFFAIVSLMVFLQYHPAKVQPSVPTDFKNATYIINDKPVTLVNGHAESEAAPGSASKIITQYFGNEANGDLNGDGMEDVAFLITQSEGGSGTFYYAVVALKTAAGYQGTNAILLGDRIAPQTTGIINGKVVVNYAERESTDAMSSPPSVGTSKFLIVNGTTLTEVPVVSADLYPLYAGVLWNTSLTRTITVGNTSVQGGLLESVPSINSTNTMSPASVFMPFEAYYAAALKNKGWRVDTSLEAGGSTGGQTAYRKGADLILTQFHITYQKNTPNTPSACPCNVTLSLFSTYP
jgi:hypothetical protein